MSELPEDAAVAEAESSAVLVAGADVVDLVEGAGVEGSAPAEVEAVDAAEPEVDEAVETEAVEADAPEAVDPVVIEPDQVLLASRDVARAALAEITDGQTVGADEGHEAVSYTHLDVYKRQAVPGSRRSALRGPRPGTARERSDSPRAAAGGGWRRRIRPRGRARRRGRTALGHGAARCRLPALGLSLIHI